jgi:hypothetical protein
MKSNKRDRKRLAVVSLEFIPYPMYFAEERGYVRPALKADSLAAHL